MASRRGNAVNNSNRYREQHDYNVAGQVAFANSISTGKHGSHTLDVELTKTGPHAGKIVCVTCNKFVAWIPKAVLETL